MATPIDTRQERVLYSLGRGALRTGREQHDRPSSAIAKLDRSSPADGRADRVFDPARRLGHPPSWSRVRSSSAIRRAGLFVFLFRGSSLFETCPRDILPRVCREGFREEI
ncbi:hypothetical protein F2Q69_00042964 [Brassica cretica]|uniref:Uncharacterized protein n=1 Tax=Brassica cretica TaxID=69181 RepID=A0A8S9NLC5_BRACR|nr:hypothetical protein F2Q69_00042964 [Brassica cretica]